jgi:hypothetical protein
MWDSLVIFENLTAANIKIAVLRNTTPCSLVHDSIIKVC